MKTLNWKKSISLCLLLTALAVFSSPVVAATAEEIQASIEAGTTWLVDQQNLDNGSWANCPSHTGFAVIKLEERAFELGLDPFDPAYSYKDAVEAGLNFIFQNASLVNIGMEPAGNPDRDGDGRGVCFGGQTTYHTGICMMAVAASRAPNRVVNTPGSPVNGWTYKDVLDDAVDFMCWAQADPDCGVHRGGWRYGSDYCDSDNSNAGYAVLGLAYAESPLCGFNCTVPQFVKNELSIWIDAIQDDVDHDPPSGDDGGSWYDPAGWPWVNILKTGNLIFEMRFVGDPVEAQRLQDALGYIERTWNNPSMDPGWKGLPPHYQSMYCVMKGLTYAGIDTIDVGGTGVDWYDEFADAIVANQNKDDGSWPGDYWGGNILATEWALLTLEAIAPPVPEPFGQWVYAGQAFQPMNLDDYVSGGTLPYTWTHDPPTYVTLNIGPGNVLTITYPPGWYGEEVVRFTVTDAIGFSRDVYATFTVIGMPVVGDIPDQTMPFVSFDLDDYLSGMKPEDVKWTASDPPIGWTVEIASGNIVTVTPPQGATDPVTITFTATSIVCPEWWLNQGNKAPSDSDDATFIPNQPPDCSGAAPSIQELWPPDHKWVEIRILGVTDPDGDPVTILITGITSDEPTASDPGSGGPQHAPDGGGIGTSTARVRAERTGNGNGRVYEIHFTATDGKGGVCEGTVKVGVPHDMQKGHVCVDDGQKYDATQIN